MARLFKIIRLKVNDACKILVFASGFFFMRAFYSRAVGMETRLPSSLPVVGSSEVHGKRLLAKEAEAIEEEFNRSGPIYVGHLGSQDTARSSSGPRFSNDAIPVVKPQALVEADSIVEKEMKGKEPLVDLSSPQDLTLPIQNLSPGMAGLSSSMLRGRGQAIKGVDASQQRVPIPPHRPAAASSLTQDAVNDLIEKVRPQVTGEGFVDKWENLSQLKQVIQDYPASAFSEEAESVVKQVYRELNKEYPEALLTQDSRVLYNNTLTNGEYVKERGLVDKRKCRSGQPGTNSKQMTDNENHDTYILPAVGDYKCKPKYKVHIVRDDSHSFRVGNYRLGVHFKTYIQAGDYVCTMDPDTARRIPNSFHKRGRFLKQGK